MNYLKNLAFSALVLLGACSAPSSKDDKSEVKDWTVSMPGCLNAFGRNIPGWSAASWVDDSITGFRQYGIRKCGFSDQQSAINALRDECNSLTGGQYCVNYSSPIMKKYEPSPSNTPVPEPTQPPAPRPTEPPAPRPAFNGMTQVKKYTGVNKNWDIIEGFDSDRVIFYDRDSGVAQIYEIDSSGNLSEIRTLDNLLRTWTTIAAVGGNRIMFYSAPTGSAVIYSVDAAGGLSLVKEFSGFRTTWTDIVRVDGGVIFHEKNNSYGEAYAFDAAGYMKLISSNSDLYGSLSLDSSYELLTSAGGGRVISYDRDSGRARISIFNGQSFNSSRPSSSVTGWKTSWTQLALVGNGGGNGNVLFYEAGTGTMELYNFAD